MCQRGPTGHRAGDIAATAALEPRNGDRRRDWSGFGEPIDVGVHDGRRQGRAGTRRGHPDPLERGHQHPVARLHSQDGSRFGEARATCRVRTVNARTRVTRSRSPAFSNDPPTLSCAARRGGGYATFPRRRARATNRPPRDMASSSRRSRAPRGTTGRTLPPSATACQRPFALLDLPLDDRVHLAVPRNEFRNRELTGRPVRGAAIAGRFISCLRPSVQARSPSPRAAARAPRARSRRRR